MGRKKKPKPKMQTGKLTDVLPLQDHYYFLWDGKRFANHGASLKNCGVLVFANLERAEQFMLTVGRGMPEFKPQQVSLAEFFTEWEKAGAICLSRTNSISLVPFSGMEVQDG